MRVTREHERYCVDLRVDYSTRDAFVSNRVTNLSRGGLFIESDRPLPVATEVDLTLTLPGTEGALKACGRVIWNYDIQKGSSRVIRGMGIKLLDMGSDARRTLEKYIENLQPADALPASS
jgi:type IV pilus assembly protein PilZ